jgi:hypothetical protein
MLNIENMKDLEIKVLSIAKQNGFPVPETALGTQK